ncbi:MAG: ABC transporter substrate-binding protein [Methanotrichaceae archaeon]
MNKKLFCMLVALALCLPLCTGVALSSEYPKTVTDSAGREVTIYKPIERIIVMNTESFEALRTLKATDKVVGVSKYIIEDDVFYPGFSGYPNVGTPWSIDYEVLLECDPDVVFTYTKYPKQSDLEDKFGGTNITVIRFDFSKLSNFVEEIRTMGYLLEREEEADEFIEFYNKQMGQIREGVENLPDGDKPKVYLEADFGGGKIYYTCGEGHGHHEMLAAAGGNNIFSDVTYAKEIDPEAVIVLNPDIIVKYKWPADAGLDKEITDTKGLEEIREEISGRPELQNVTAMKNGRVYVFTRESTRGAARYFLGIGCLAKWFHPDLFDDLNPRAVYQEYLTRFQGLNIDLDEHGVFVYPEVT